MIASIVFGLLLLSASNTAIVGMVSIQFLMSRDGEIPRRFGVLNGYGVPWVGLVPAVVLPCEMDFGQGRLSLFTTVSTLGTPQDITLSELAMELFYPADGPTRARLEASAAAVRQSGDMDRREPSRSIAANLSASSGGLNR
jgi:hypothetical protein